MLSFGGAERVLIFLSKNLNNSKFESELIVIGKELDNGYETTGTNIQYLNCNRVSKSIPKLISLIKKRKPDIVFGTLSHVNLLLGFISFLFPKVVFVGRQTSITKIYKEIGGETSFDWFSFLLKFALKKLGYVICQSKDMVEDCVQLYNLNKNKLKIINNPITDNFQYHDSIPSDSKHLKFITVGRLVTVKGHARILQMLTNIDYPFNYTIIGDGSLKNDLLDKIEILGLSNKIQYIPFTKDVAIYLRKSDYFLQGSLSEGFPNALLESCAVGTPVIAFDVPGGTKEIVENGINGFMVKDGEEFLYRLNHLPKLNPKSVSESVYKKFDKSIILKKYEDFFLEIAN
ncbi:glycosyltransferase [Maribacter litopenaei]|uniref:Glycosyltransferase n=1 Tax=Maribacter litopenaei TaxID=2976127 RepID=A0ABY5YCD7_9FLAO|nr:glycosyltransferase [Maribacter litopenaei]UWX56100.1 glycosyltransferase [Maribacter litopenaei]